MTAALDAMIAALDLEVAAIRKNGGGTKLELRGGERVGELGETWLYRFALTDEPALRDDTPVKLSMENEEVDGSVVSLREGVLLLALPRDLGPRIAVATLVARDSFLVERLQDRLTKIKSGDLQFGVAAAERALGQAPCTVADREPAPMVTADGALNSDQVQAVRRSLGSDTTFVWGPPGTGKTTTLARIVEAHYRAGRSVLLVSNTNIAVDTALERVAERLQTEPDFQRGLVIRQGPVVKEELRTRFGQQVVLPEVVARLGAGLRANKEDLEREASTLGVEKAALTQALRDLELLAATRATLSTREHERGSAHDRIEAKHREAADQKARAGSLAADLERARRMGALRRFFSGLNLDRLEGQKAAAEQAMQRAEEQAAAVAAQLPALEAAVAALQAQVADLSARTHGHPEPTELSPKIALLEGQLRDLARRIDALRAELTALEKTIVERCRVLATTAYRTYLGGGTPRQFDAVVVDEASMLMPPLVYYTAGLAAVSVTVAGDFRQLPPIVVSREAPAQEWLSCDAFEKAGIPQRLARREPTPELVALGTQYRMRSPICALVNELFYTDRPLRSHAGVDSTASGFPLGEAPLLFVDTAAFNPWAARRAGSLSRYNLLHALLVRNIVLHLAETGYLPPVGQPNDAVGAVAAYAAQAKLIQALLEERLGPRAAGVAATVHRFQGNEKRVMIIDLTDSLGLPLGHFFQAAELEQEGARLLNVAVSRARHHLVLMGNFRYLRENVAPRGFVRRLVDHVERHGEPLAADGVLALSQRDWVDGLHSISPARFELPDDAAGAFHEGNFYPAFQADIERAGESLVILSPFLTPHGTARWADSLRAAVQRGVQARVVTRPPEDFGAEARDARKVVAGLRALGVAVDLRARMHEKLAVVDGRILWHGSLNILSHRDTHESMLRFQSPLLCSKLGEFLGGGHTRRGSGASAFEATGNPSCQRCEGPMVRRETRMEIVFECEDPECGGKTNRRHGRARPDRGQGNARPTRGGPRREGSAEATDRCPEAGCGGTLRRRTGRYGPFLGCSNYPNCRHTVSLDE